MLHFNVATLHCSHGRTRQWRRSRLSRDWPATRCQIKLTSLVSGEWLSPCWLIWLYDIIWGFITEYIGNILGIYWEYIGNMWESYGIVNTYHNLSREILSTNQYGRQRVLNTAQGISERRWRKVQVQKWLMNSLSLRWRLPSFTEEYVYIIQIYHSTIWY